MKIGELAKMTNC